MPMGISDVFGKGLRIFLPPDIIDSIIRSSYEQGFDEYMEGSFSALSYSNVG